MIDRPDDLPKVRSIWIWEGRDIIKVTKVKYDEDNEEWLIRNVLVGYPYLAPEWRDLDEWRRSAVLEESCEIPL